MERAERGAKVPELSPRAGAEAFDAYKDDFPEYDTEQLILGFEEKLEDAITDLIEAYGSADSTNEERRKAVAKYGAVVMAKHGLLYHVTHDPCASSPAWLKFGRSDLLERTQDNGAERAAVERTPIFSEDAHVQRALGDVVTASIVPQGEYSSLELARGVVGGRITIQPF